VLSLCFFYMQLYTTEREYLHHNKCLAHEWSSTYSFFLICSPPFIVSRNTHFIYLHQRLRLRLLTKRKVWSRHKLKLKDFNRASLYHFWLLQNTGAINKKLEIWSVFAKKIFPADKNFSPLHVQSDHFARICRTGKSS